MTRQEVVKKLGTLLMQRQGIPDSESNPIYHLWNLSPDGNEDDYSFAGEMHSSIKGLEELLQIREQLLKERDYGLVEFHNLVICRWNVKKYRYDAAWFTYQLIQKIHPSFEDSLRLKRFLDED